MLIKRGKQSEVNMINVSVNQTLFFFILCSFFISTSFECCFAKHTIKFGSSLSDQKRDSLVSEGEVFELGFFSPNRSKNDDKRYVGIWFCRSNPETVIWVANRDKPISGTGGVFSVSEDGNLRVSDKTGEIYWSSDMANSSGINTTAKISDSGNLVLSREEKILWQSFENPTDTFLPGMMLDENLVLTSWRSHDDPASGNFTFQQDPERKNQVIISRRSVKYWNSGVSGRFINVNEMPPTILFLLSNFTSKTVRNSSVPHLTYALYKNARLVMSVLGQVEYIVRDSHTVSSTIWAEPRDKCSVYNSCGNFGSCNSKNNVVCKCLPGFRPVSPDNWNAGEYSSGCGRKTPTCGNVSETDTFLDLKMMKVGNPDSQFNAKSESDCETECLNNCQCQAYLYEEDVGPACWIWSEELSNLQEVYESGRNLRVRVAVSDIETTERVCETCGTSLLPYPLSTGSDCGDPLYDGFGCNETDGQLMFETLSGSYRVTNIDPDTGTFFVRIKDVHSCGNASSGKYMRLNLSFPFHAMGCNSNLVNFSTELISKDGVEVEIIWEPPLEPICSSLVECRDIRNSSCRASRDRKNRCLCDEEFRWDWFKLQCTKEGSHGARIGRGKTGLAMIVIVSLIGVGVLVLVSSTVSYIFWSRKRPVKGQDSIRRFERNPAVQRFESERRTKTLMESGQFKEDDTKGLEVPFFDLESVLSATDCFSNANKLGQGGFGVVYKGKLSNGTEIAVKRLSSGSGQGHEEFKNEVLLIAKLQHRNLVRLLGYCIEAEERMLIYEYMANKSLDSFIFDRKLCAVLDWDTRFNVILGIARGLLYLHQDSRLRIIHRDLKTSNVLLDKDMNPKISDFGLARIFDANEISANTKRVVGTYGYMSPEYALDGLFSLKSDVFSFGVVVIEIISGKRNTGFFEPEQSLSLLGYAWHLWIKEKALDLMEKTLSESCKQEEYLKCITIGLLCVQEDPIDRPTMSNVVFMLGSEMTTLPTPKQPAFVVRRCPSSRASSSGKPETYSQNELTVTLETGR